MNAWVMRRNAKNMISHQKRPLGAGASRQKEVRFRNFCLVFCISNSNAALGFSHNFQRNFNFDPFDPNLNCKSGPFGRGVFDEEFISAGMGHDFFKSSFTKPCS